MPPVRIRRLGESTDRNVEYKHLPPTKAMRRYVRERWKRLENIGQVETEEFLVVNVRGNYPIVWRVRRKGE